MLQFKMLQILLFEGDLSYILNFCTFTTSSFANVGLGFVFHIHFQSSNIYIDFCTLRYTGIQIFFPHSHKMYCWNLLLKLEIWFLNLLLSLNFKFKRF
jgi:hypothetical protein